MRLARQGDAFVVRDGRHRVAAALAAGHRFIEAEVRPIARLIRRLSAIARSPSGGRRRSERGDEVLPEEHLACTEEEWVRLPPSPSVHASVVSTASTRLLYGRGAGSTPAGGSSNARSSADSSTALRGQRTLVRIQPGVSRGRSSSGQSTGAPLRRGPFEPGRPLSLPKAPGVTESTASSNLAGPGSTPGGPAHSPPYHSSRAGAARLSHGQRAPSGATRFEAAARPHSTTATLHPAAGRNGSGYRFASTGRGFESRSELPCSGSSAGKEQFRASHTTAATSTIDPRAGLERLSGERPARAGRSASSSLARGGRAAP